MKLYNLHTSVGFGKFKGMTIKYILDKEPNYLIWCLENLDHFIITDEIFNQIPCIKNTLHQLTKNDLEGIAKIEEEEVVVTTESTHKLFKIHESKKEKYNSFLLSDKPNYFEKETYGNYRGSYAQDVMGYSDEYIDDAFGGEPEAYWNID
jgi:hypothetical protein|tara:strand:+ start:179 stop:628 length:450 start_codon:yes stop_codon:yes gene_type:complete